MLLDVCYYRKVKYNFVFMIHMLTPRVSGLTGELGMDSTGILDLQDYVPLPRFLSEPGNHVIKTDDDLFIQYHFLAQVTLRTLIDRIRSSLPTAGTFALIYPQLGCFLAKEH